MRILITGGAGFIGRHLVAELLNYKHEVHVLDICEYQPIRKISSSELLRIDIGSVLDASLVDQAIADKDLVIHLAGIVEPIQYCKHPKEVMDVTLQGSMNVIHSAMNHKASIFFASTSETYGYNPHVPWSEQAERLLGPTSVNRWCYATAKAAIEHYLFACRQDKGLNFVITRFFNLYGAGLKGRVIDRFIRQALASEPLLIHGDGSQIRTFLYIDDAIEAVRLIISHSPMDGRVYNIGNTTPIRITQLAKMILELTNSSSSIKFVDHSEIHHGYSEIPVRIPLIERIEKELGWKPKTSLADGLRITIDSLRKDYKTFEVLQYG